MTTLSTHVLDTATGKPAAGIPVACDGGDPVVTDGDGRARFGSLDAGDHELVFAVGQHLGPDAFYDAITVAFRAAGEDHLHVPLLLSPFGYSTYRGS